MKKDNSKPTWKKPERDVPTRDHYQEVTDRIVAALEEGKVPWKRPWDPAKSGGPMAPVNAVTGKNYRGINTILLGMDSRAFESQDPRWCTFKQAKEKGWNVKKGERSSHIFFFKPVEIKDDKAEDGKKAIPVLRSFSVFHASQIEGIPAYEPKSMENAVWRRPEAADTIMKNSGARVLIGGERAFYSPSTDHIQLPPDRAFETPHAWAATALHELGHWTGHKERLNRDLTGRFGSGAYAQEELRAELASVFVGTEMNLPADIPQHASYVASWLKALRNDKREIFWAASDAQKISDHCLSFHPEWAATRAAEAAGVEQEQEQDDAPEPVAAPAQPSMAAMARTSPELAPQTPQAAEPGARNQISPVPQIPRRDFAAALKPEEESMGLRR